MGDVKSGKYKSSTTNMHFSILARLLEIVNNTATITSTTDLNQDIPPNNDFIDSIEKNNILSIALPNGVLLICPWSIKNNKDFQITMGYQRINKGIQLVELCYDKLAMLQKVYGNILIHS